MPEVPERGSEQPPEHMGLVEMVNAATSEAEWRIDRVERFAERLRTEMLAASAQRRRDMSDDEWLAHQRDESDERLADVVADEDAGAEHESKDEEWLSVNYFAAEIPDDAQCYELAPWPDGRPRVAYTYFTGAPPG